MNQVLLLQLPLHPGTAWEPTGNIPLAAARLAAAAGLPADSVLSPDILSEAGDRKLIDILLAASPEIIGVTLYLWNVKRTLYILEEYRKLRPGTMIIAGGPEVTEDNHQLLKSECIDLFVSGEGESRAKDLLNRNSLRELLNSGTRFLPPVHDTSPPEQWPDPWETGHLPIQPGDSIHVETQRGCGSLCSYCAYRRTSPVPRITPAKAALEKLRSLRERGASEFVFLDPTFNSRPDLSTLLLGMRELGAECFAEVRGDLIRPEEPDSFTEAGFTSLEVGLQTMNEGVLRNLGRKGSPERILSGAEKLHEAGVSTVMDLILGLPGDTPESVERAAEEIVRRGIGENVQTFCLSVLPGTELRAKAASLGVSYSPVPPYCVSSSGKHTIQELLLSRERISDTLGYDADPPPRPVLCSDHPSIEVLRPGTPSLFDPPSVRHGVLRIESSNPWEYRDRIMNAILTWRKLDPYCVLDVVIQTAVEFPLDLLDSIGDIPQRECYITEKEGIYGTPGLLRTAVSVTEEVDQDWLQACSEITVTVVERDEPSALPGGRTGVLLRGRHDLSKLLPLYSAAPELVFFSDSEMEKHWNLDVLGLG